MFKKLIFLLPLTVGCIPEGAIERKELARQTVVIAEQGFELEQKNKQLQQQGAAIKTYLNQIADLRRNHSATLSNLHKKHASELDEKNATILVLRNDTAGQEDTIKKLQPYKAWYEKNKEKIQISNNYIQDLLALNVDTSKSWMQDSRSYSNHFLYWMQDNKAAVEKIPSSARTKLVQLITSFQDYCDTNDSEAGSAGRALASQPSLDEEEFDDLMERIAHYAEVFNEK